MNVGVTRKGGGIQNFVLQCTQILNVDETRKQHFSGNQRYICTHTKTMNDVCTHSSLPTLAILALDLLKKERRKKMMNNFAWAVTSGEKRSLEYLPLHKHVSAVLKVCTNADTTVENAYTVKSA